MSYNREYKSSVFAMLYEDNINVGSGTVTITGKGNYTGSVSKTFKIEKAAFPAKAQFKYDTVEDRSYTGTATGTFEIGNDFSKATVTYKGKKVVIKGVKKGTAKVTVTTKNGGKNVITVTVK